MSTGKINKKATLSKVKGGDAEKGYEMLQRIYEKPYSVSTSNRAWEKRGLFYAGKSTKKKNSSYL
jgi:hypothetical protein